LSSSAGRMRGEYRFIQVQRGKTPGILYQYVFIARHATVL
jgi:hypothetical protein